MNTTTEIRRPCLWRQLYKDFCRDSLVANGDEVVIMRYGEPMTAMVSYEDYAALIDELDDLRSARRASAILADLEAGRTTSRPLEEIEAELLGAGT